MIDQKGSKFQTDFLHKLSAKMKRFLPALLVMFEGFQKRRGFISSGTLFLLKLKLQTSQVYLFVPPDPFYALMLVIGQQVYLLSAPI